MNDPLTDPMDSAIPQKKKKKKKKKKKTWQIDWATYTQIHTPTVEPQEMVIFCAWHIKNNT